jgi:hypothetical protein
MEKIKIHTIIEIAGSPKEHVESTINKMMDIMKENKNLNILKKEIAKAEKIDLPAEIKNAQNVDVFSAFAELEIEMPSLEEIMGFCYTFMPSSLEIMEPESVTMNQKDLENSLNDLLGKLHDQAKIIMEYQTLKQQIIQARQKRANEPTEKQ